MVRRRDRSSVFRWYITGTRMVSGMELATSFEGFNDRDWEPDGEPGGGPVRLAVVGLGGYARDRALPAIRADGAM